MKQKMFFITLISALVTLAFVLSACGDKKLTPEIRAENVAVEFDGETHGVEATLSIQGGLDYHYTGVDNSYDSDFAPKEPGEYTVNIKYTSSSEKYADVDKSVVLTIVFPYTISADGTEISAYSGSFKNIVLPTEYRDKTIISLEAGTFSGKGIESVKFPLTEFAVDPVAFANYEALTRFYISENTRLLDGAYPTGLNFEFYGNPVKIRSDQFGAVTGIGEIIIPQSVLLLEPGSLSRLGIELLVLPSHLPLDTISLSGAIKKISVYNGGKSEDRLPDNFFKNCVSVEDIEIRHGLNALGDRIFGGCSSLNEIVIRSSIQFAGAEIFADCSAKKLEFDFSFSLRNQGLPPTLTEISAFTELTEVPQLVFSGCEYVEKISLPDSVKSINNSAFYGCKSLKEINIPTQLESVGYYAFYGCLAISEIALPDTVVEILDGAFRGCTSLTDIGLSERLQIISPFVFDGCTRLASVVIPEDVKEIGSSAFGGCGALKAISLPSTVESIGADAFAFCTALEEITFPASVNTFGSRVFISCDRLTSVSILSTTKPATADDMFSGLPNECTVYVPSGLLSVYASEYPGVHFEALS